MLLKPGEIEPPDTWPKPRAKRSMRSETATSTPSDSCGATPRPRDVPVAAPLNVSSTYNAASPPLSATATLRPIGRRVFAGLF